MRGFVVVLALLAGWGCARDEVPAEVEYEGSGVEREIDDFYLAETEQGQLQWELTADKAFRIPEQSEITLQEVELRFFDPSGEVRSVLTSRKGFADEESGDLRAENSVRVVSQGGDTLTTEVLYYNQDEDRVWGPGAVRLAQPDRVLTGMEFESNSDLTDYKVHRDVHVTIIDHERQLEAP